MPEAVHHGKQGDVVRRLQDELVARGYFVGSADGNFGDRTDAALRYFQSCSNLRIDGIADTEVYDMLGIADVNDTVHIQLPQADVTGPGNYTVYVTGTASGGARVDVWFQGVSGPYSHHVDVQLAAGQAVPAEIPLPEQVVNAPGQWHVTCRVYAPHRQEPIGEEADTLTVTHHGS